MSDVKAEDLKLVTVDSYFYLGTVVLAGESLIRVENAVLIKSVHEGITQWFEEEVRGNLKTVNIPEGSKSISYQDLEADYIDLFEQRTIDMRKAQRNAMPNLIAREYRDVVKG